MQLKGAEWSERAGRTDQSKDSVLLVLAAASLADVLPRIGDEWERTGGLSLAFSFAATSRLAVQAAQSGSGDVFFSADLSGSSGLRSEERCLPAGPSILQLTIS